MMMKWKILLCLVVCSRMVWAADGPVRAGIARVTITPEGPMWLNGYAGRDEPSKGVLHDIWAKALVVESSPGSRIVIVTTDLLGLSHEISEDVIRQVDSLYGVKREQLLLNSSHTHSAPMIWPCVEMIYNFGEDDQRRISQYDQQLTVKLVKLIGTALGNLAPAKLYTARGSADFAINRREKLFGPGPVDHDVPVLKVVGMDGKELAILFGYACHNTTLVDNNFLINGDYAGFAQLALEKAHPGVQAMFLMGCAGDQNPAPRGTVEFARTHGQELADAVQKVLAGVMHDVRAPVYTAYTKVDLPFRPFEVSIYQKDIVGNNKFLQRRAKLMLEAYNRGMQLTHVVYPVQAVRFGDDLTILALSDEVVVDYSLRTKREFTGENIFVAGYSSEVMCYIPSERVLKEGGYEGEESMIYYGFPGPFATGVEDSIFKAIRKVMAAAGSQGGLRGTLGTYAFPPRDKKGKVDQGLLIRQLKELHANTYHWLAWGKANDIKALADFLPVAREAGIKVWVTLVPQSESPPFQKDYSEPYRLDFKKWAVELAKLSLKEPNLVAWSIDDFVHNLKSLTPEYVKDFQSAARAINPRLAFIPCSYFEQVTPAFAAAYGSLLDGILFPYRNESVSANLQDATHVESEIAALRTRFSPGFPVFLDIYATAHSSLGDPTAEYVKEVLARGMRSADGVLIYCHQDPEQFPAKYKVIKEGFAKDN
jgi:hypothetical protein